MFAELQIFLGLLGPLLVRAALWGACLHRRPTWSALLGWTAASASLNQVVGYRSGDALRVLWARHGTGLRQALSSVLLLRGVEGLTMVVGAVWLGTQLSGWGPGLATGVTAACLTVLLLAPRLARAVPGSELLQPLAQLRVSSMANLVLLSVTAFALEGLFFAGVMQLLHVEFDARLLCTCVIAATAGQALSWLPASLGTYELTLAGAMAIAGVSGDALWQIPVVTHALRFSAHAFLLPTVMLCRPRQLAMPVSSLPVSESTL